MFYFKEEKGVMKDIKKVTLIGLGAMGVFFAPRIHAEKQLKEEFEK